MHRKKGAGREKGTQAADQIQNAWRGSSEPFNSSCFTEGQVVAQGRQGLPKVIQKVSETSIVPFHTSRPSNHWLDGSPSPQMDPHQRVLIA